MSISLYVPGAYYIAEKLSQEINTVRLYFSDNTNQRYNFIAKEIILPETEDVIILKLGIIVNVDVEKTVVLIEYEKLRPDDIYELIMFKDTSINLTPGLNIIEHEIRISYEPG